MRSILGPIIFAVSFASPAFANEPYKLTALETQQLEIGVREDLIDPESARFFDIEAVSSSNGLVSVCGYVNAKNSFGGYVGKRAFFGSFRETGFELRSLAQDDDTAAQVKNRCNMFGIW